MFLLKKKIINTPLGAMVAIADEKALYLLEFTDRPIVEKEIALVCKDTKAQVVEGITSITAMLEQELESYFAGKLYVFKTPVHLIGTAFQKKVWHALIQIPLGSTCSYAAIAAVLGKPTAFRAVALANSANKLSLIIPCHRVIKKNGDLCGYGGGVSKKAWLLKHEKIKSFSSQSD